MPDTNTTAYNARRQWRLTHFVCGHPKTPDNLFQYKSSMNHRTIADCRLCRTASISNSNHRRNKRATMSSACRRQNPACACLCHQP